MGLFKKSTPFEKVMAMYNELGDEDKAKVHAEIMDVEKAEDEREVDKIEEDKADNAEVADEKEEDKEEETEEIGKEVDETESNEEGDIAEEDKEPELAEEGEPEVAEEESQPVDNGMGKIEELLISLSAKIDSIMGERGDSEKSFGLSEENKDYNGGEQIKNSADSTMKKYFIGRK